MFLLRTAAIGLQKQGYGSEAVAVLIGEFGAEFEQEGETVRIQRFARPQGQARNDARAHGVQTARGFELALQARPVERMLKIFSSHLAQHRDNRVLPDVGRVRHRRTPVAVGYPARGFVQQLRILQHQLADRIHIAAPDRVSHAAGGDQTRPIRQTVAAGQRGLGVC